MVRDIIIYTPMFVTFLWSLVLLSSSPKNNRAKFFLGIFMFVCFLLFLSYAFYFKKQVTTFWYFDLIFVFCALSVFPLNYCYIKLLTVETSLNIKDFKIFLPALILLSISAINYIIMSPEQRLMYVRECIFNNKWMPNADMIIKFQKSMSLMIPYIYVLQIIYTFFKSRTCIKKYNKTIANFYSNIEDKTINWAGLILNSLVITSVLCVFFCILGRKFFMNSTLILFVPSISFSVLLFIIGYLGNIQNYSVALLEHDIDLYFKQDSEHYINVISDDIKDDTTTLKEALLSLFENERIYTNHDLKIIDLAQMLRTNRTYISNIINNDFSTSFTKFVNQYRIQKAKEMLNSDISKNYTLEFISQEVGFGSVHTFIRAFKEIEGITPGAFREINNN